MSFYKAVTIDVFVLGLLYAETLHRTLQQGMVYKKSKQDEEIWVDNGEKPTSYFRSYKQNKTAITENKIKQWMNECVCSGCNTTRTKYCEPGFSPV